MPAQLAASSRAWTSTSLLWVSSPGIPAVGSLPACLLLGWGPVASLSPSPSLRCGRPVPAPGAGDGAPARTWAPEGTWRAAVEPAQAVGSSLCKRLPATPLRTSPYPAAPPRASAPWVRGQDGLLPLGDWGAAQGSSCKKWRQLHGPASPSAPRGRREERRRGGAEAPGLPAAGRHGPQRAGLPPAPHAGRPAQPPHLPEGPGQESAQGPG